MTTLFLLLFGAGLLAVAYQGYRNGRIRAGGGLRPYTPTRADDPLAFHFFILLYILSGFALLIWGILVLAGRAEPLPLN